MVPSHPHRKVDCLLEYWRGVHRGRLPGRRDFDPTAHAELLPNVTLVEVHREPLRFRYRLLGSRADTVLGRRLTGQWLDGHRDFCNGDDVLKQYVAVVETAQPFWRRGTPHLPCAADCAAIEVLRLPLATDGKLVDMVLSLSVYFDDAGRELDIDPLQRR